MCMEHTVYLSSLCKWKHTKWLFFVVKRYAVREAKKWRYAVRKAKNRAVCKGVGGYHPHSMSFLKNLSYLFKQL